MNKQEAIEKIEKEKSNLNAWEDLTRNRALDDALAIVRKLDEPERPPEPKPLKPEKPVVPQFVADWYEENKDDFENSLAILIRDYFKGEIEDDNLLFWFGYDLNKDQPIKTLVNMHQFGYEVEKEKLYTVEIPNPNITRFGNEVNALMMNGFRQVVIKREFGDDWKKQKGFQLTEAQIKKDFEWAWQFKEEVKE